MIQKLPAGDLVYAGKGHSGYSGAGSAVSIADTAVVDKATLAAEEHGRQDSLQGTGQREMPASRLSVTSAGSDADADAFLLVVLVKGSPLVACHAEAGLLLSRAKCSSEDCPLVMKEAE